MGLSVSVSSLVCNNSNDFVYLLYSLVFFELFDWWASCARSGDTPLYTLACKSMSSPGVFITYYAPYPMKNHNIVVPSVAA